jgi:hypothetical protein
MVSMRWAFTTLTFTKVESFPGAKASNIGAMILSISYKYQ